MANEQIQNLRDMVEKQRNSYNNLLSATERRVIQANHAITQAYSEHGEDDKRQAAEFLGQQIYTLYEERRTLLSEKDRVVSENNALQRTNIAYKFQIDKFAQLLSEDGNCAMLMARVDEL